MLVSPTAPAAAITHGIGQVSHVPTGLPWLREGVTPACSTVMAVWVFDQAGELHNPRNAQREAKRICATCPYMRACREWGIENRERWGIWGGLNRYERNQVAASRGIGVDVEGFDDE